MYPGNQDNQWNQNPGRPAQQPSGEQVLAEIGPSAATYRRGAITRLAILAPLIIINLYSASTYDLGSGAWWWALIGVVAIVVIWAVLRMIRRVQVTPSSILVKRAVGDAKAIPLQQMAYGILVERYQQFGNAASPLLIVVDSDAKKLLQLSGQLFAGHDMYTLAQAIGLQRFDVIIGATTPKLLSQRHPRVLSFPERRPWAFAFLFVAVLLVVFVIVALISTSS